jgi:hypothetical protein
MLVKSRKPIWWTPWDYHNPLDNSCESCDREEIPFGSGGFMRDLWDDMESRPIKWLEKHYPELTFGFEIKKGNGHVYSVNRGYKKYIWADWKK